MDALTLVGLISGLLSIGGAALGGAKWLRSRFDAQGKLISETQTSPSFGAQDDDPHELELSDGRPPSIPLPASPDLSPPSWRKPRYPRAPVATEHTGLALAVGHLDASLTSGLDSIVSQLAGVRGQLQEFQAAHGAYTGERLRGCSVALGILKDLLGTSHIAEQLSSADNLVALLKEIVRRAPSPESRKLLFDACMLDLRFHHCVDTERRVRWRNGSRFFRQVAALAAEVSLDRPTERDITWARFYADQGDGVKIAGNDDRSALNYFRASVSLVEMTDESLYPNLRDAMIVAARVGADDDFSALEARFDRAIRDNPTNIPLALRAHLWDGRAEAFALRFAQNHEPRDQNMAIEAMTETQGILKDLATAPVRYTEYELRIMKLPVVLCDCQVLALDVNERVSVATAVGRLASEAGSLRVRDQMNRKLRSLGAPMVVAA